MTQPTDLFIDGLTVNIAAGIWQASFIGPGHRGLISPTFKKLVYGEPKNHRVGGRMSYHWSTYQESPVMFKGAFDALEIIWNVNVGSLTRPLRIHLAPDAPGSRIKITTGSDFAPPIDITFEDGQEGVQLLIDKGVTVRDLDVVRTEPSETLAGKIRVADGVEIERARIFTVAPLLEDQIERGADPATLEIGTPRRLPVPT